MQDPSREIVDVVKQFTAAATPDEQKAAIERYFTDDAGFQHPMCSVTPGPNSRSRILGIYQWYRVMSPQIDIDVESLSYDPAQQRMYLNIVQTFHIFLSLFPPTPTRLLVRLTLREDPGTQLHYISQQDDYYQPEDLFNLTLPPVSTAFSLAKRITGPLCGVYASIFQTFFGMWKPTAVAPLRQPYSTKNINTARRTTRIARTSKGGTANATATATNGGGVGGGRTNRSVTDANGKLD